MAVGVLLEIPGMTQDQYDAVAMRLGWAQPHPPLPPGLLIHTSGPTERGWRIFDVWDSEESFRRFSSVAVPRALQGLNIPQYTPQVFQLHHMLGPSTG